jgi:hypothetical protein
MPAGSIDGVGWRVLSVLALVIESALSACSPDIGGDTFPEFVVTNGCSVPVTWEVLGGDSFGAQFDLQPGESGGYRTGSNDDVLKIRFQLPTSDTIVRSGHSPIVLGQPDCS